MNRKSLNAVGAVNDCVVKCKAYGTFDPVTASAEKTTQPSKKMKQRYADRKAVAEGRQFNSSDFAVDSSENQSEYQSAVKNHSACINTEIINKSAEIAFSGKEIRKAL